MTIDDSERLKQSNRHMAENIQHMEDEKDSKMARLEAEAERMRLEVERVRKEVAEIRDRGGATAGEILNALLKLPKSTTGKSTRDDNPWEKQVVVGKLEG